MLLHLTTAALACFGCFSYLNVAVTCYQVSLGLFRKDYEVVRAWWPLEALRNGLVLDFVFLGRNVSRSSVLNVTRIDELARVLELRCIVFWSHLTFDKAGLKWRVSTELIGYISVTSSRLCGENRNGPRYGCWIYP